MHEPVLDPLWWAVTLFRLCCWAGVSTILVIFIKHFKEQDDAAGDDENPWILRFHKAVFVFYVVTWLFLLGYFIADAIKISYRNDFAKWAGMCQGYFTVTSTFFYAEKLSLYAVLLLRLKAIFHESAYDLTPCQGRFVVIVYAIIFVYQFSTVAFVARLDSKCRVAANLVGYATLLLFDLVFSVGCLWVFTKKYRQLSAAAVPAIRQQFLTASTGSSAASQVASTSPSPDDPELTNSSVVPGVAGPSSNTRSHSMTTREKKRARRHLRTIQRLTHTSWLAILTTFFGVILSVALGAEAAAFLGPLDVFINCFAVFLMFKYNESLYRKVFGCLLRNEQVPS